MDLASIGRGEVLQLGLRRREGYQSTQRLYIESLGYLHIKMWLEMTNFQRANERKIALPFGSDLGLHTFRQRNAFEQGAAQGYYP